MTDLVPPGQQPTLFVLAGGRERYRVVDTAGITRVSTGALGIALAVAQRLAADSGQAWITSVDGSAARLSQDDEITTAAPPAVVDRHHQPRQPWRHHEMTTTTTTTSDPTDSDGSAAEAPTEAPVNNVAAHPDNPRRHLGDLTELVRSMKAHGVLQPLLVLPADEHGVHLVVAGHRRHAAAVEAGLDRVPIVVRDLDRAAVIEAMLVENTSRDDLTISRLSAIASDASFVSTA